MAKITTDIDIDFSSKDAALRLLDHRKASIMRNDGQMVSHNSGVYFTEIPHTPNNLATIDYRQAEERGYFKVDFLNVSVYEQVKSEEHLLTLMHTEPQWDRLKDRAFVEQLIHVNNHYNTIMRMPEPVNSLTRLAMLLAVIRPGKKHLIGSTWKEVAKTVWDRDVDGYTFRKSHAIAYAHLVVVHMNLLITPSSELM